MQLGLKAETQEFLVQCSQKALSLNVYFKGLLNVI